ncbi:dGTP triphosphohydrolase [Acinetobacter sp. LoGeW2-3]|uniref:thiamine phosphate synthase n=1 Tax=Acinetobacter sp. LoGeW2-3 TaxID=1808001 RepID=UPI000C05C475|nr:thiamine phosphate synthase [Acinetobacter sp. LoGeW2-3]ATO20064.1 dGTP triphosphohydrolase [Acinetobacter sp. LoGeW2-3]
MSKPNIHVAIALLFHQNQVLVGWREAKLHQGNKHEFPGGKVEDNETPVQACRREIQEEVGIDIELWHAFDFIRHEYEDVIVHLHLFHASVAEAQLAQIQQPWNWYSREQLQQLNFPKANDVILEKLLWPQMIKISSELVDLQQLSSEQMLYWRVDANPEQTEKLKMIAPEQLSKLIINYELYLLLNEQQQQGIKTLHLKQGQLNQVSDNDRVIGKRYIAACHDLESAQRAEQLGCEAIFLSPVLPTATHTEVEPLGWAAFDQITIQIQIPAYALGGIKKEDLNLAQSHHAYGIAGIRGI